MFRFFRRCRCYLSLLLGVILLVALSLWSHRFIVTHPYQDDKKKHNEPISVSSEATDLSGRVSGDATRKSSRIHVVAYSDKILQESCMSIETALFAGWTYHLITDIDKIQSDDQHVHKSSGSQIRNKNLEDMRRAGDSSFRSSTSNNSTSDNGSGSCSGSGSGSITSNSARSSSTSNGSGKWQNSAYSKRLAKLYAYQAFVDHHLSQQERRQQRQQQQQKDHHKHQQQQQDQQLSDGLDDMILFVDAFDVIFQGTIESFQTELNDMIRPEKMKEQEDSVRSVFPKLPVVQQKLIHKSNMTTTNIRSTGRPLHGQKDIRDSALSSVSVDLLGNWIWHPSRTVLYNAEDYCHPFHGWGHKHYRCPLTQGEDYLQPPYDEDKVPLGCQLQIDRAPVLPSSVVKSYPLDADVKRYFNDKNLQSSMSIQGNHQDMNSTAVDATAKVTATATATAAATATKMRNITQSQPGNPQSIYSPSEYHPAEAYIPVLTTVQTNLSAASRGKIKIYKKQVYLNSGVSLGTASVYKKIFDRAVGLINNELPELCLEDQGIISWMYGKEGSPMSLDFISRLLATSQVHVLRDYKFDDHLGMWKNILTGLSPHIIHFAGSKRAYKAYYQRLKQWYINRLGGEHEMQLFLQKSFILLDGKRVPYRDVCKLEMTEENTLPHYFRYFVSELDMILKRIGLSRPPKEPPVDCPPEFCPRFNKHIKIPHYNILD